MQLDIAVSCNSSVDCTPSHIICELVLRGNSSATTKDIAEDRTKCAKKEVEPILPTNGHGFGEESVTDEIRGIAAFAVQQLESNGDAKRSLVDIMSVKRQVSTYIESFQPSQAKTILAPPSLTFWIKVILLCLVNRSNIRD
jgi:hypothetical protein